MRSFGPLLIALAATFTPNLFAEDVPYVHMKICDEAPYASKRDYWDNTKTFCYETINQQIKLPISSMGEIKLRENGKSIFGPYFEALTEENRAIVSEYKTYYVRYLALEEAKAGQSQSFVTQVFFNWGGATMTIYAFGEVKADGNVVLNGFSDSQKIEGNYRSTYNTIKNLGALLNANRQGVNQTKAEDRTRIKPAADVVKHFTSKDKPAAVAPDLSKP